MKAKFLSIVFLAFTISFFSCSKNSASPANSIIGLWVGTLTANNEPAAGNLYYSFDIRADSTILTQSEGADGNTYYNQGKWTLSGTTFKATTTSTTAGNVGVVQTLTATYSSNGTLSSGVWGNQVGTAQGTFSLSRIN